MKKETDVLFGGVSDHGKGGSGGYISPSKPIDLGIYTVNIYTTDFSTISDGWEG